MPWPWWCVLAPDPGNPWTEIAGELQILRELIAQVRDLAGAAAGRGEPLAADPTFRRRLVDIGSHLRGLRTRLQDVSDRLREEPEAEEEGAALDCIVQDHLEPALSSLRCLLQHDRRRTEAV
jgi:hypothetical protein